jgi:protein-tyrosine kinase
MANGLSHMDLVTRLAERIDLNADLPRPDFQQAGIPPLPYPDRPIYVPADNDRATPWRDAIAKVAAPTTQDRIEMPTPQADADADPALATDIETPSLTLDREALEKCGYLTSDSTRSLLAEQYRLIKRPLLRMAADGRGDDSNRDHIILVTSARPGEGKTFTSINLAMSMASEKDVQVLLIDGDVCRKGVSRALGVSDRKGLMNILCDADTRLDDVILRTNIPNFHVLPAGGFIGNPTEILAGPRMKSVMFDLARRYDGRITIFDSPPALASSEPGVLAAYVGQVIMVVRANETTSSAIDESLALLDACPKVNFLMNRVTSISGRDRFGHFGYYDAP